MPAASEISSPPMIPYGRQDIDDSDVESVVAVLRSDFLTQGPAVPRFEEAVARYCGARQAVAMSSATAALHLACRVLDVGAGDAVWTSAITFAASANCALYCGASVDFVDIDPATGNMSAAALEHKLATAARFGKLPKVIIPVHHSGLPCDMEKIHGLATAYGCRVIEDAAHAIGARYRGTAVGDGRFSDITVFSFHPVKVITTGEGGMALTNEERLAGAMRLLRSHGITRDPGEMTRQPEGPWYYEQIALGFNYRMTDIQAALGTTQLARLDQFLARRRRLAERYDGLLESLPLRRPWRQTDSASALHLYVVRLDLSVLRRGRRYVFEALRAAGIGVNVHYLPVYLHPYYENLGFRKGHCPEAERYYEEAISLPIHPRLSDADQDRVVHALAEAIRSAS